MMGDKQATVSVIIPVKNRTELLRKTLDNLLGQSLKPAEIIVVDDHSTEDMKPVIFDYLTECIFLNNKGQGPGAARNLGLSVATGKYIQYFDSDDLMTQNKIAHQVKALEESGLDWAYGPYVMAEENQVGWSQTDVIMQWHPLSAALPVLAWILRGWNCITQSCLFRKSFLDQAPLWNERLITHEDYLYLYKISQLQPSMIHVPNEGVLYRQHGTQSTNQNTRQQSRSADKMEVLIEMRNDLNNLETDWLSKLLFKGRFYQNYAFLKSIQGDYKRYSGYVEGFDIIWEKFYRLYNHLMRRQTQSNWEPMHGISSDARHFEQLKSNI